MLSTDPEDHPFRMPAEWEPQQAIWFTWLTNPSTWTTRYTEVRTHLARLIALISQTQDVSLVCKASEQPNALELFQKEKANLQRITLLDCDNDDVWCRDHGPTFVLHKQDGNLAALDWQFNAWGGKFPYEKDNRIAAAIAAHTQARRIGSPLICEGGALEVNGAGTLLTTESVLMSGTRNPGWERHDIEDHLRPLLGVQQIIWLPAGLPSDDTDGHIDTLARFVSEDTVVVAHEPDASSEDHKILTRLRQILEGTTLPDGRALKVIPLPQPAPIPAEDGTRTKLPATYANFLITNHTVIVPTYNQPEHDTRALDTLRPLFPNREVIGFDCSDIIHEGGTIHCLTQQQPATQTHIN